MKLSYVVHTEPLSIEGLFWYFHPRTGTELGSLDCNISESRSAPRASLCIWTRNADPSRDLVRPRPSCRHLGELADMEGEVSQPQEEIPSECRIAGHIYREVRSDATHVTARCIRCPREKRFSLAKWADRGAHILLHWLGG